MINEIKYNSVVHGSAIERVKKYKGMKEAVNKGIENKVKNMRLKPF